jgi:UDP-N-acetylglucosamine 2-epimerase (non-hydrolysing)
VITDSGGLQEEATFFNKRVIICRKTTERPEGLSTGHLVLCSSPEFLREHFFSISEKFKIDEKCPYGDGHSSERIQKIIQKNEF